MLCRSDRVDEFITKFPPHMISRHQTQKGRTLRPLPRRNRPETDQEHSPLGALSLRCSLAVKDCATSCAIGLDSRRSRVPCLPYPSVGSLTAVTKQYLPKALFSMAYIIYSALQGNHDSVSRRYEQQKLVMRCNTSNFSSTLTVRILAIDSSP